VARRDLAHIVSTAAFIVVHAEVCAWSCCFISASRWVLNIVLTILIVGAAPYIHNIHSWTESITFIAVRDAITATDGIKIVSAHLWRSDTDTFLWSAHQHTVARRDLAHIVSTAAFIVVHAEVCAWCCSNVSELLSGKQLMDRFPQITLAGCRWSHGECKGRQKCKLHDDGYCDCNIDFLLLLLRSSFGVGKLFGIYVTNESDADAMHACSPMWSDRSTPSFLSIKADAWHLSLLSTYNYVGSTLPTISMHDKN